MNSFRLSPLPANFTFCTLMLPIYRSVALAMLLKKAFIRLQKPPESFRDRFQTKCLNEFNNAKIAVPISGTSFLWKF